MKRDGLILAALLSTAATWAEGKVMFTGYSDFRYNATAMAQIRGDPATLANFGLKAPIDMISAGFSANAIGLFAATEIQDDLRFVMDLTFRNIGSQVGQTAIQYAYLEWNPAKETVVKGGRVTLPFGYYNENRFYAFQRYAITPPVFQSAILGLPIADWGVAGFQRFPFKPFTLEASAYVVNGYANQPGHGSSLRTPRLPGGIALANNLGSTDNNHKPAAGGRLRLTEIGGADVETGVSYYAENWDSSGLEPLYLVDAHVHAQQSGFDLLVETLHFAVRGDQGFMQSIGATNWTTDGGFATAFYNGISVAGRTLAPFAQTEIYRTRPNDGGTNREVLRSVSGGLALKVNDHLLLKTEYLRLAYELPDVPTQGTVRLIINAAQLSAVVTF